MEIKNAIIKNAVTDLDESKHLVASMELHTQYEVYNQAFRLQNLLETKRLVKLMEFVEEQGNNRLEGKIIRVAEHEGKIKALGHPIYNIFFDLTNNDEDNIKELADCELLEKYSN